LAIVNEWLMSFDTDDAAMAALAAARVAAAPVLTPWEALTADHSRDHEMVREVRRSDGSTAVTIATPYRMSHSAIRVGGSAFIGEHNDEVLSGMLGMESSTIEALTARGILYREPVPAPDPSLAM
jgi:crotonobetainyl-CoA:carnitine CoA-transferase CaiB-like acyl-CoA transferase